MRTVTEEQLVACLRSVGIERGDGLLVHSALHFLGRPDPDISIYLRAIEVVIGEAGTLVVPTFNFAFAQGEPYDPELTPSVGMGAFSEYVRQHPQARRSPHPMQSIAALGAAAIDLISRDTLSAFDPGSAFDRMLELDFKLLLLGAGVEASSIFHYSEQRYNVPYRYWKDFTGQVKRPHGWERCTYRMFVRDLELNPILTADPVQALLEERGQWHSASLNYGKISTCRLVDFVAAVDHFLAADPWSLVTNPPGKAS